MTTSLNERNTLAIQQAINGIYDSLQAEIQRNKQLQESVTMLTMAVQKLQQDVAIMRALALGRGPTA